MLPRNLSRVVAWAKVHHLYGLEFEERGMTLWAFVRTWEKDTFRRVALAVSKRFLIDATHDLSVLGSVVAAVGGSAPFLVFLLGCMCWPTLTASVWEVRTFKSWLSTQ